MNTRILRIPFFLVMLVHGFLRSQPTFLTYDQIRVLSPSVPGAWDNSISAYANPAAAYFVHGPELVYLRSDPFRRENNNFNDVEGLFGTLGPFGLGMVSDRYRSISPKYSPPRVNDFRLSFSGGSKSFAFGMGYGWSGGNRKAYLRDQLMLAGIIARPSRYVSLGLSGAKARHSNIKEYVMNLSIRPFKTEFLTLFADKVFWNFKVKNNNYYEEPPWSVGASVDPIPGMRFVVKLGENKFSSLGAVFSLGGLGVGTTRVFDRYSGECIRSIIRLGAPQRNVVNKYLLKDKFYLSLDLHGRIAYQKYRFFDSKTVTLTGLLEALRMATEDSRVRGIAVNLCGTSFAGMLGGLGRPSEIGWEVREALLKVRRSGKRVVAFLDEAGMNGYYVASAADRIVMDPEGMVYLEGFAVGKTYLKGLLDKLGLGVTEFRYFKYKSAAEVLARDGMSEADREQLQAYVDDCYCWVRREISGSRRFSETKFDTLVNERMVFTPDEARSVGLVDTLGRWSDAEGIVAKMEGGKKAFIGPGQLAENIFPSDHWGGDREIAVVYALGACDLETGIQARKLERILRGLEKDASVKAIVLRSDSPGGSALASDLVSEAMKSCKKVKPVIVSQGDVAGSGGYWISMDGDTIVSGPMSLTGSIGVIGMWLWNRDLGDKLGLRADVVQAGKHADLIQGLTLPLIGLRIPGRDMTADEKARAETLIRGMYDRFVAKVAAGRKIRTEDVYPVAEGRIWSGVSAREKKLVDVIGGLDAALELAKKAARIPTDRDVKIVEYPEKGWFNPDVFMPKLFGIGTERKALDWREAYLKLVTENPGRPMPVMPLELIYGN